MVQGYKNAQIAAALGISHYTVKVHCRHIQEKLQAGSREHVVALALEKGLVGVAYDSSGTDKRAGEAAPGCDGPDIVQD